MEKINLKGNWKKKPPFEIAKPRDIFNPYLVEYLEKGFNLSLFKKMS